MTLRPAELERLVAELAQTPEHWRGHIRHSTDIRVYEQLRDDEDVNVWVICWSDGQDTGFHDHDGSAAAIAVVQGQVREERLRLDAGPHSRVLGAGATLYVAPTTIHRVVHAGGTPAVTIHAYSPPLTRTGTYSLGPGGELQRAAQPSEHELRAAPALA